MQDLGALGAATGPPARVFYTPIYNLWSIAPWVVLIPFLALKRNRNLSAWWVLAPVVVVSGLLSLAGNLLSDPTDGMADFLQCFFAALALGLGVMWLLAAYLERKPRWLIFLIMLFTLALVGVFGGIAFAAQKEMLMLLPGMAIGGAFLALNASLAFWLASLVCRKRYTVRRFVGWLFGLELGCWIATVLPFALIILFSGDAPSEAWLQIGVLALVFAGTAFLVTLAFLVLSFVHPQHRARLHNLLAQNQAPPLAAPVPPAPPLLGEATPPPAK